MSAARVDPDLLARNTDWVSDAANSPLKTTYKAPRRYRGFAKIV